MRCACEGNQVPTSLTNGTTRRACQSRWHWSEQKKSDGELARSVPQTTQGSVIPPTSRVDVHHGR